MAKATCKHWLGFIVLGGQSQWRQRLGLVGGTEHTSHTASRRQRALWRSQESPETSAHPPPPPPPPWHASSSKATHLLTVILLKQPPRTQCLRAPDLWGASHVGHHMWHQVEKVRACYSSRVWNQVLKKAKWWRSRSLLLIRRWAHYATRWRPQGKESD